MNPRTPSANPSTARSKGLGLLGAIAVGVVLATQSRINGTLGSRLQDGAAAALISFGSGLVLLLIATACMPAARRGIRQVATAVRGGRELRWWQLLGGVSGGYLVFSQGLSAATLGVALFTVAVVAGQVTSGMLVDRIGLGPAGPQQVTPPRVIGGVLAVVAVVIAVAAKLGSSEASWLIVVPAIAGIGVAWQQAVNGRINTVAENPLAATLVNFTVGTLLLVVVVAALPSPRV